jgi:hypothetical protein
LLGLFVRDRFPEHLHLGGRDYDAQCLDSGLHFELGEASTAVGVNAHKKVKQRQLLDLDHAVDFVNEHLLLKLCVGNHFVKLSHKFLAELVDGDLLVVFGNTSNLENLWDALFDG